MPAGSCVSGYDDQQWGAGRLAEGHARCVEAWCARVRGGLCRLLHVLELGRFQCSQPDPLRLVLGEPLLRAVVQLGRARALVARNVWQPLSARSPSENRRR